MTDSERLTMYEMKQKVLSSIVLTNDLAKLQCVWEMIQDWDTSENLRGCGALIKAMSRQPEVDQICADVVRAGKSSAILRAIKAVRAAGICHDLSTAKYVVYNSPVYASLRDLDFPGEQNVAK